MRSMCRISHRIFKVTQISRKAQKWGWLKPADGTGLHAEGAGDGGDDGGDDLEQLLPG